VVYAPDLRSSSTIGAIPDDDWHRVLDEDVKRSLPPHPGRGAGVRAQDGGNLVAVIHPAAVERVPSGKSCGRPKAAIEMCARGGPGVTDDSGQGERVGPGWIDTGSPAPRGEQLDEHPRKEHQPDDPRAGG